MARQAGSRNRGMKSNQRSASGAKNGGASGLDRAGRQESSSVTFANGMAEVQTEGQDCLHQRIAELAYVLYERSGFQDGHDLEHWLNAERQIKGVRGQAA